MHATTIGENTLSSSTHGTFLKIDRVLGHKASLSKRQRAGTILSEHKATELKINNNENKTQDTWKFYKHILK